MPAAIYHHAAYAPQDITAAPGERRGQLVSSLPSALSQVVPTPQADRHLGVTAEVEQG
jgi:hypothetical protein